MKKTNHLITILKSIATLLILNTHGHNLYPPSLKMFATVGIIGMVVFFFLSGYGLTMGRMDGYFPWIKRRLLRILPSCLIWGIASIVIWKEDFNIINLFCFNYWFVVCILVYYLVYYWVLKYARNILPWLILASVAVTVTYFFIHPKEKLIYGFLNYVCYFSFMLMGTWFGLYKETIAKKIKLFQLKAITYLVSAAVFTVIYYGIIYLCTNHERFYYWQISSLIPLHLSCLSLYLWAEKSNFDKLMSIPVLGSFILMFSSITLEIYLVQFRFLTDFLIQYFPLNMLVIFAIICATAFAVNYGSRLIGKLFKI